jgi:hypothetical protein
MRGPIERQTMCEDLLALKREAALALRRIKQIRRSRDISFFEDSELSREKHAALQRVLKHLLVGHQGRPCPAGERPIVNPAAVPRWARPPARPLPRLRQEAVPASGLRPQAGIVATQYPDVPAWPQRLLRYFREVAVQSSHLL